MKKRLLMFLLILIPFSLIFLLVYKIEKIEYAFPETITIQKNVPLECYDPREQYEPLVIIDQEQIKTIVNHLNKVRYVETFTKYEFCKNEYVIELKGKSEVKVIRITKTEGTYYLGSSDKVIFGKFDFLDGFNFNTSSE